MVSSTRCPFKILFLILYCYWAAAPEEQMTYDSPQDNLFLDFLDFDIFVRNRVFIFLLGS